MRQTTVNEYGETVIRINAPNLARLTQAEVNMIDSAASRPYVFDEDCPPLEEEFLRQMDEDAERQHQSRRAVDNVA